MQDRMQGGEYRLVKAGGGEKAKEGHKERMDRVHGSDVEGVKDCGAAH